MIHIFNRYVKILFIQIGVIMKKTVLKTVLHVIIVITASLCVVSCAHSNGNLDETEKNTVMGTETAETDVIISPQDTTALETKDSEGTQVLEESEFYKLIYEDNGFYCIFYDEFGGIVKKEGPMLKAPKITCVDGDFLKMTVQAGPELSTQSGCYFDTATKKCSEWFQYILDESNGLVACATEKQVIVRDIFDGNGYYKEISDFKCIFSIMVDPIIGCEFIGDNRIEITYMSGENYQEITEVFEL